MTIGTTAKKPTMQQDNRLLTEQEEARLRATAESKPKAGQPRLRLARHYWLKGELEEALVWTGALLALEPGNINASRIRAKVLVAMKQTGKAVSTALHACAVAPQSVPAHLLAVRMMLEDLQPRKAQEILDQILELDPGTQHLQQLKSLQHQILAVSNQAERRPLNWITRKFNRRRANVAAEQVTGRTAKKVDSDS